jgi:hypothetical protein
LDLKFEIASRCAKYCAHSHIRTFGSTMSSQFFAFDDFVEREALLEQYIDTPLTVYMEPQEAKFQTSGSTGSIRGCKRVLQVIGRSYDKAGEQVHCCVDVVFTAGFSSKVHCQRVELILSCDSGDCTYTVSSAALVGAAARHKRAPELEARWCDNSSYDPFGTPLRKLRSKPVDTVCV